MSWGVKTTCFKAPGVSLGGSGVSIGGVRSLRVHLLQSKGLCRFLLGFPLQFAKYTFLGTNISPPKARLKMRFLFPRWDILVPWRVSESTETFLVLPEVFLLVVIGLKQNTPPCCKYAVWKHLQ